MISCNKCHKAIKSDTADEFCKCCYPEPEEVKRTMTVEEVITYYHKNGELPPKEINNQTI